jgi:hypothetical protein
VSGSAIFRSENYNATLAALRKEIERCIALR